MANWNGILTNLPSPMANWGYVTVHSIPHEK
ncbi:uncharacterized protein G2W53_032485 [Senna tora]|uniref:Uncharacterized protein n=1 Tax=Senna tora TaxID=362788 RepID=A0A834SWU0_9FABA|nr:uncharacterized protein G2W53_032485 [Senna tora]